MLSPQSLIRGLVQRALPSVPNTDSANNDAAIRQFSYGEIVTQPLVRKAHNLADEGSYFVANMGVSAQNRPIGTSYSATAPWFIIQNQTVSQRLYLDYLAITAVTATTAASGANYTAVAIAIDPILRYSTNGTAMTLLCPNLMASNPTGINAYGPSSSAMTASAASGSVRLIVPQRLLRPAASGTALSVVGDVNLLNFGGVEGAVGSITIANANIMPQNFPPVIIGPGHSAVIYTWLNATTPAAGTDLGEIGFWVR